MDSIKKPLNILVIEDNDDLRETILDTLGAHGHQAKGMGSAEHTRRNTELKNIDLFIIDLNLPGEDGLSLAKWLREYRPDVGIIMLTARGQSKDRSAGYRQGADIYLTKPASMDELHSGVLALSRRLNVTANADVQQNQWLLKHIPPSLISPEGTSINLTASEFRLLKILADHQPHHATKAALAAATWQNDFDFDVRRVEVAFSRLRKKLSTISGETSLIQARRSEGYVFGAKLCLSE